MPPASHNASKLCAKCQLIDFKEACYPRECESEDGYTSVAIGDESKLNWAHLFSQRDQCTFCTFLLKALSTHPDSNVVLDAILDAIKHNSPCYLDYGISLSAKLLGTACRRPLSGDQMIAESRWRMSGEWERSEVRQLNLHASTRTREADLVSCYVDIFPTAVPRQKPGEALLHARPMCTDGNIIKLVNVWLTMCLETHGQSCDRTARRDVGNTGLRMIDVLRRCVVLVDTDVDYIALSYCWGSSEKHASVLKLTTETLERLEQDGALDKDSTLPQTIADAIFLAQQLQIRYLWVDMLCIIQNDEAAKDLQINHMDSIYKHASLTVIAAAGDNVHAGLPGLRKGTRPQKQAQCTVSELKLTARPKSYEMTWALDGTAWSKRAWTLQEHLLSKRCLYFTKNEMFWECDCAHYREALQCEAGKHTQVSLYEALDREVRPLKVDVQSLSYVARSSTQVMTPFQRIVMLMNQVSAREIGFEEDRLKAMQGILNDMSSEVPGGFIWGMPRASLEVGLMFDMNLWGDSFRETRRQYFPSWSYLGWSTTAVIDIGNKYTSDFLQAVNDKRRQLFGRKCPSTPHWITKEVAFFLPEKSNGKWQEVSSVWIDEDHSLFYEESRERWHQQDAMTVWTRTQTAVHELSLPLSHVLAFWTQVVLLNVDYRKTVDCDGPIKPRLGRELMVRDDWGRTICHISLHTAYRIDLPQKLRFILIAQNRRLATKMAPFLNLIHIETTNGISRRSGSVRDSIITLDTWHDLNPHWELIVMV